MKNNLTKQKNSRALLAAPALSGFSTRSVPPPMLNEARSFFVNSEVIHRLTIIESLWLSVWGNFKADAV